MFLLLPCVVDVDRSGTIPSPSHVKFEGSLAVPKMRESFD
jgi:hypothetical protein